MRWATFIYFHSYYTYLNICWYLEKPYIFNIVYSESIERRKPTGVNIIVYLLCAKTMNFVAIWTNSHVSLNSMLFVFNYLIKTYTAH